jgi:hypothetical protein
LGGPFEAAPFCTLPQQGNAVELSRCWGGQEDVFEGAVSGRSSSLSPAKSGEYPAVPGEVALRSRRAPEVVDVRTDGRLPPGPVALKLLAA